MSKSNFGEITTFRWWRVSIHINKKYERYAKCSFVKDEDIQDYCLSYNDIPYFYWSAKTGDNVEDTFTKIAELSFNRANQEIIKKLKEKKFIKIDKRGNIIIPKKKIENKQEKPKSQYNKKYKSIIFLKDKKYKITKYIRY